MSRIEVISSYTNECIGYFGDTNKEKQACTRALGKMIVSDVVDCEDVRKVYVQAFALPEE